jgi:hypothetical protein
MEVGDGQLSEKRLRKGRDRFIFIVLAMGEVTEIEVFEIGEVVHKTDKRDDCDIATLQRKV